MHFLLRVLTSTRVSCANFLMIYNLPIYFQSVMGSSPTKSGIQVLPLIVSACKCPPGSLICITECFAVAVFVVATGIVFTKFPFYQLYLVVGATFTAIGAGLLYTLKIDSYAGEYLGYQFVVGIGNGVCQQIPLTVVQAFSKPEDLAISMSTLLCRLFFWGKGNLSLLIPCSLSAPFRGVIRCCGPVSFHQPPSNHRGNAPPRS